MDSGRLKMALAVVFFVSLLGFSLVRVWPYVVNQRSSGAGTEIDQLTKVIMNPVVPQYELVMSEDETADLVSRIFQKVKVSLMRLPTGTRPNDRIATSISSAYAGFVIAHRVGDRLEYLENYPHEKLPSDLTRKDPAKADKYWLHTTAWARNGEINVDSIRVTPHFIRGQEIEYSGSIGTRYSRALNEGLSLEEGLAGSYSAYKIYLSVTVPSYDGKEMYDLELGIMMLNDGPNGVWSPVSCEYLGVPMGAFVFTPRP